MFPDCIIQIIKQGDSFIIVWGCFTAQGVEDLIGIDSNLKKEEYKHVVCQHAYLSGKRLICKGYVIQGDNDQKQSSKLCAGHI